MTFNIDDYEDEYEIEDIDFLNCQEDREAYVDRFDTPFTGIVINHYHERYEFVVDGIWHREDGPARVYYDGTCEWFIYDNQYTFEDYVNELNWTDEAIIEWKLTHEV